MYHVIRNAEGAIETVSRQALPGSQALDAHDPELLRFLGSDDGARGELGGTDADFVRVLEDLIDTLIMKNVIRHTDLPAPALKKLALRKGLRQRLHGSLDLLGGDHGVL